MRGLGIAVAALVVSCSSPSFDVGAPEDAAPDTSMTTDGAADGATDATDVLERDVAVDVPIGEIACPSLAGGVPTAGTGWRDMATAPIDPRADARAVWTGAEMIVWGGRRNANTFNDGAAYHPLSNTWRKIAPSPLAARAHHGAVWTGSEMLVWGGEGAGGRFADGARYDPACNTWTMLVAAPILGRRDAIVVWSQATKEMIVWGGVGNGGTIFADGAAFNPSTNKWRLLASAPLVAVEDHSAAFVGNRIVVFAGQKGASMTNQAALYDPVADAWKALSSPGIEPRQLAIAVSSGAPQHLALFYGGEGEVSTSCRDFSNGAFIGSSLTWATMAPPDESPFVDRRRKGAFAWWASNKMWIWGGQSCGVAANTGMTYDPSNGSWAAMPAGGPSGRYYGVTVFTGVDAILWGGTAPSNTFNDGRIFRP